MVKQRNKYLRVIFLVVVVFTFLMIIFYNLEGNNSEEISVLILGDTAFVDSLKATNETPDYYFTNFKKILNDSDYVITNLDSPLTSLNESYKKDKLFVRRDNPERLEFYKENNMKIFSVANSHIFDYGEMGFADTVENLEKNGMSYFGAGFNESSINFFRINAHGRQIALISALVYDSNFDVNHSFYAREDKSGVLNLNSEYLGKKIKDLKKKEPNTFLIVMPHWIHMYSWKTPLQEKKAEELADKGVDLIIGTGTNVLLELEKKENTLVVYGLGNFVHNVPSNLSSDGAPFYSFVSKIVLTDRKSELRLYPIFTNTLETNFQPRFVTKNEMNYLKSLLEQRSGEVTFDVKQDEYGYYFYYPLPIKKSTSAPPGIA